MWSVVVKFLFSFVVFSSISYAEHCKLVEKITIETNRQNNTSSARVKLVDIDYVYNVRIEEANLIAVAKFSGKEVCLEEYVSVYPKRILNL